MVVHCFSKCPRLIPLFSLLAKLFEKVGEVFSIQTFIFGFKYRLAFRYKCQLLNFILGQSKMAVYMSRKRKVRTVDMDLVLLFSRIVKARVLTDFKFFKEINDLNHFRMIWTYGLVLCGVEGDTLIFLDFLI